MSGEDTQGSSLIVQSMRAECEVPEGGTSGGESVALGTQYHACITRMSCYVEGS